MIKSVSTRGRTTSIRFGTDDIREDLPDAEAFTARRVYSDGNLDICNHRHTSGRAALKCARSVALGQPSCCSWESYVEVVPHGTGGER